ncbi:hypothetical protein MHK_010219, partial [Candidatus Magnetomorum sp. HK-1]
SKSVKNIAKKTVSVQEFTKISIPYSAFYQESNYGNQIDLSKIIRDIKQLQFRVDGDNVEGEFVIDELVFQKDEQNPIINLVQVADMTKFADGPAAIKDGKSEIKLVLEIQEQGAMEVLENKALYLILPDGNKLYAQDYKFNRKTPKGDYLLEAILTIDRSVSIGAASLWLDSNYLCDVSGKKSLIDNKAQKKKLSNVTLIERKLTPNINAEIQIFDEKSVPINEKYKKLPIVGKNNEMYITVNIVDDTDINTKKIPELSYQKGDETKIFDIVNYKSTTNGAILTARTTFDSV